MIDIINNFVYIHIENIVVISIVFIKVCLLTFKPNLLNSIEWSTLLILKNQILLKGTSYDATRYNIRYESSIFEIFDDTHARTHHIFASIEISSTSSCLHISAIKNHPWNPELNQHDADCFRTRSVLYIHKSLESTVLSSCRTTVANYDTLLYIINQNRNLLVYC